MEDHSPILLDEFWGHYDRGGTSDDVPKNYFRDTLNLKFDEGRVDSRDGLSILINKANIIRYFPYKRINENPRYLILDNSGSIFDSLVSLISPIYTDSGIADFTVVTINNRAYITIHNRINGTSGKYVLVYDGTTIRNAAGQAPTGFSLGVSTSASAGDVEAGTHLFAVCFETDSGFITPPGPALFTEYTAPGNFQAHITNVPLGPAGTAARRIIATKVIPNYDGNQFGTEFFFVPDGRIANNTDTTVDVSFFDDDLISSADYLFDIYDLIPAGLGMIEYAGRIVYWGVPGFEHILLVSNASDPETINQVSGFVTVYPSDNVSNIKGCWENRGVLYIRKVGGTYQVTDNSQDPVTWNPTRVDDAIGGDIFCASSIIEKIGTSSDFMFIAHISGLYVFAGKYSKPDISYNIKNIWKRINKTKMNLVQIVHHPNKYQIYCVVPLDNSSVLNYVLYADYTEAITIYGTIDHKKVKWSIWQLPGSLVCISSDYDVSTKDVNILFGMSTGNIYKLDDTVDNDFGNTINSYGACYLADLGDESQYHWGGCKIRARGSGTLNISLTREDEQGLVTPAPFTLTSTPGRALFRQFNYSASKCSIKFGVNNGSDWFSLTRIVLFVNKEFENLPQSN